MLCFPLFIKRYQNVDPVRLSGQEQNRYVMEGWLFAKFVAMIAYYKLYVRLLQAERLSKYSPKDIIECSKAIYQMKIRGQWHQSEITKKRKGFSIKSGLTT
ncbi:MAG: hypothetical protein LBS09_01045 [Bacteroidales bacterium]|jgi:hypothetical protein|nr:hypothetical protein [Bacteroidales bacterium]